MTARFNEMLQIIQFFLKKISVLNATFDYRLVSNFKYE